MILCVLYMYLPPIFSDADSIVCSMVLSLLNVISPPVATILVGGLNDHLEEVFGFASSTCPCHAEPRTMLLSDTYNRGRMIWATLKMWEFHIFNGCPCMQPYMCWTCTTARVATKTKGYYLIFKYVNDVALW